MSTAAVMQDINESVSMEEHYRLAADRYLKALVTRDATIEQLHVQIRERNEAIQRLTAENRVLQHKLTETSI